MKVKDISKSFGNRTLFSSLTFSFSKGLLVLKGKSGCGKTTLRKIRMGKEKPAKGTVIPFSSFSYCGRDDSLFSVFSLKKNLFIFNKDYDKEKLDALLTSFSFESYFDTPILSLSGGERQKAEIIFCLLKNADCYYFDEPFSSLDKKSKETLRKYIDDLRKEKAVVLINHDSTLEIVPDRLISFSDDGNIRIEGDQSDSEINQTAKSVCSARFHSVFSHLVKKNGSLFFIKTLLFSLSCVFFALALSFTDCNSQVKQNRISMDSNPYTSFRLTRKENCYLTRKREDKIQSAPSFHKMRKETWNNNQYLFFSSSFVSDDEILFFAQDDNKGSAFTKYSVLEYDGNPVSFRKITEEDPSYQERMSVQETARVMKNIGQDSNNTTLLALSLPFFNRILEQGRERLHFVNGDFLEIFNPLATLDYTLSSSLIQRTISSAFSYQKSIVLDTEHPDVLSFPVVKKGTDVRIPGYGKKQTTEEGTGQYGKVGIRLYQDILLHQGKENDNHPLSFVLSKEDYSKVNESALEPLDIIEDYSYLGKDQRIFFYFAFGVCLLGYVLLFIFSYPKEKAYIKERNNVLFYQGCKKRKLYSFLQSLLPVLPAFLVSVILYFTWFTKLSNQFIFLKRFSNISVGEVFGMDYASVVNPIPFYSISFLIIIEFFLLLVYFVTNYKSLMKEQDQRL